MWSIFKSKISMYLSKANLDIRNLFGKITCLVGPEMKSMLVRGLCFIMRSKFSSGP